MEGAAGEEKSGRLVIQKEELCGTIPRSASDRFHVTLGLETPSPGIDCSGATLHVERREIERKMREKKGGEPLFLTQLLFTALDYYYFVTVM